MLGAVAVKVNLDLVAGIDPARAYEVDRELAHRRTAGAGRAGRPRLEAARTRGINQDYIKRHRRHWVFRGRHGQPSCRLRLRIRTGR